MGYLGELGDIIGLTGGLARYRSVVVAGATGVAERAQVGSDPSFQIALAKTLRSGLAPDAP